MGLGLVRATKGSRPLETQVPHVHRTCGQCPTPGRQTNSSTQGCRASSRPQASGSQGSRSPHTMLTGTVTACSS